MALFSPDSNTVYAPVPNVPIPGGRPGGLQVVQCYQFRHFSELSRSHRPATLRSAPADITLLVFADDSDSVFLINLAANPSAAVEIPGFARPVNAFFSSDSNTAYVINCGLNAARLRPASVRARYSFANHHRHRAGGRRQCRLSQQHNLVCRRKSRSRGVTYDAVDVSSMTRVTANSVAISDGYHSTMALATNNKLYIGASTCTNHTTGCLSVVDVSNNTADPPLPPKGNVTSMLAVAKRNIVYVIEGGYQVIYDTTTDQAPANPGHLLAVRNCAGGSVGRIDQLSASQLMHHVRKACLPQQLVLSLAACFLDSRFQLQMMHPRPLHRRRGER